MGGVGGRGVGRRNDTTRTRKYGVIVVTITVITITVIIIAVGSVVIIVVISFNWAAVTTSQVTVVSTTVRAVVITDTTRCNGRTQPRGDSRQSRGYESR